MSTPHVAGVAELLWMHFPECTNSQIRKVLAFTVLDLDAEGCDFNTGFGLVQAKYAYDRLSLGKCGLLEGSQFGGCYIIKEVEVTPTYNSNPTRFPIILSTPTAINFPSSKPTSNNVPTKDTNSSSVPTPTIDPNSSIFPLKLKATRFPRRGPNSKKPTIIDPTSVYFPSKTLRPTQEF